MNSLFAFHCHPEVTNDWTFTYMLYIFFPNRWFFQKIKQICLQASFASSALPSLQPLNLYNYTALVKSRTSFMLESLMMYFLFGLWLFITVSNWRARCWIKVKATHGNITKRKPARHPFVQKHRCLSRSLWALCARRLGRPHTVIHLISISLTVFLPASRECGTF